MDYDSVDKYVCIYNNYVVIIKVLILISLLKKTYLDRSCLGSSVCIELPVTNFV